MFFINKNNKVSESEIQILYQNYPYLIEEQFFQQKVVPQYRLPSGIADLVVIMKNEIVVVELKVVPLENVHLLQLLGYLNDISIKFKDKEEIKKIRGILIGYMPKCDLEESIKVLNYEIKIMILDRDVPIKIKICAKCRRAIDFNLQKCSHCGNSSGFF
ncbi:MAG: hypothetical protein ACTSRZ_02045 [Promethearchaeota archaeon]